jgi:methionyl-tRNA formyltransferase
MIKTVFFGTPKEIIPIAEALQKSKNIKLLACVTQPDRPVGRKRIITSSPLKTWAKKKKIPVLTPTEFDKEFTEQLQKITKKIDLFIVAAYGLILPKKILRIPKKGSLCLHPSLLPLYRGASPVQEAIINGNQQTGMTIFKMDEKMDHGPIVSQFEETIQPEDNTQSLYQRLFEKGTEVLVTILPEYIKGKIKTKRQDDEAATYTKTLTKNDGRINWSKTPEEVERFIRAMTPWPGAWTEVELEQAGRTPFKKRLKVLSARFEQGKLLLDQVQLEGKTPTSWKQLQKGYLEVKINR